MIPLTKAPFGASDAGWTHMIHMSTGLRAAASFGVIALAMMLAGGAQAVTRPAAPEPEASAIAAQQLFPDAPYGVDPMVTGPVSASFRTQQAEAGCAQAKWPDTPAACYQR
jgi:hypothetical protein